jgi:hypothetical protein
VAVLDFNNLSHLEKVLEESDPAQADLVVVSVNPDYSDTPPGHPAKLKQVISQHEIKVFSKAVYIAERAGKPIHLFAVPGRNVYELVLLAASRIRSARKRHRGKSVSEDTWCCRPAQIGIWRTSYGRRCFQK